MAGIGLNCSARHNRLQSALLLQKTTDLPEPAPRPRAPIHAAVTAAIEHGITATLIPPPIVPGQSSKSWTGMKAWHRFHAVLFLLERTPGSVSSNPRDLTQRIEPAAYFRALRVLEARHTGAGRRTFHQIERAVGDGHVAAGFFTYECGQAFEPKSRMHPSNPETPLAWFGIYDQAYLLIIFTENS